MFPDYCIHFNGTQNEVCGAGHIYRNLARPISAEEAAWHNENYPDMPMADTAIAKRIPCKSRNGVCTCSDYRLPTQTEMDEHEARMEASVNKTIQQIGIVRPTIIADIESRDGLDRDVQGVIDCPICEVGRINYGYAGAYNGHIHAKCSTDDCMEWME